MTRSGKSRLRNDGRWRISLLVIVSVFAALGITTDSSSASAMTGGAALDVLDGEINIRDTYEDRYCNRVVGRADCSDEPIERWVLMVWLVRSVSDAAPALEETSRFADVNPDSEWWAAHVELAAELGITNGCGNGSFCPYSRVTRAQMARFFSRAFGLDPGDPAGFEDTVGRAYAQAVDAVVAAGITGGCPGNPRRYCPQQEVTFGQMALYLARALDLLPRLKPISEPGDSYLTFDTTSGYRVTNISGTDMRVLGGGPLSLSVSPDGTEIVFDEYTSTERVSRGVLGPVPAIWSMDTNGADTARLTKYGREPVWSPDGARIAFALQHWGTETGIWVMNPDGSDQRRLQTGGRSPSWSPDGSRIAYYGPTGYDHVRGGRWTGVYVMDSDGANQQQLTERFKFEDSRARLHWSPDGTTIAYRRYKPDNPRGRAWELWVVRADGSDNRRIAYGQDMSWSADGTKIAYSTWPELWVMNVNGTGQRLLASDGVHPAWSPDGTTLAYTITNYTRDRGVTTYDNSDFEVWLMDADGANRRKLADGYAPMWVPTHQATGEEHGRLDG